MGSCLFGRHYCTTTTADTRCRAGAIDWTIEWIEASGAVRYSQALEKWNVERAYREGLGDQVDDPVCHRGCRESWRCNVLMVYDSLRKH